MIVIRHGRRAMQLAWTHLLPATFGGRAKMNVQNSLAAAGAAFAAGAHLHDIRQGLRTFTHVLLPVPRPAQPDRGRRRPPSSSTTATTRPGMRLLGDFVEQLADSAQQPSRPGQAVSGSA